MTHGLSNSPRGRNLGGFSQASTGPTLGHISVMVNTERYQVKVLKQFWNIDLGDMWVSLVRNSSSSRTGYPAHFKRTSNQTLIWLRQRFRDRLISRRCDPEWAPHLPDLTPPPPPDFYIRGYFERPCLWEQPSDNQRLEDRSYSHEMRAIPREEGVIDKFARRIQEWLRRRGGKLEHILERR